MSVGSAMPSEVTLILRFEEGLPPDFVETLEEEFDCVVVLIEEEEV